MPYMGTLGGTGLNLGLCIKHFNCLFKIISFKYVLRVSVKKKINNSHDMQLTYANN